MRLKEIETSHKTHTTMKAISTAKMWFKPVVLLLVGMAMMVFSCKKDTVDVLFTGDEYQNILQ